MAVHQAAKFTNDQKLSHERAVHKIVRYLNATNDKGILLHTQSILQVEFYCGRRIFIIIEHKTRSVSHMC